MNKSLTQVNVLLIIKKEKIINKYATVSLKLQKMLISNHYKNV